MWVQRLAVSRSLCSGNHLELHNGWKSIRQRFCLEPPIYSFNHQYNNRYFLISCVEKVINCLIKLLVEFEMQDAAAINLKFEMRQLIEAKKKGFFSCASSSNDKKEDEWPLWSRIETTLDQILNTGPVGLQLPLGLDFGATASGWTFARYVQKCIPGYYCPFIYP
jgi:hypothetical protein